MTVTHSPGPWRVERGTDFLLRADGCPIAHFGHFPECGANLALAAAGPEMLAALEEMVAEIEVPSYGAAAVLRRAEAAIAKARGTS